MNAKTIATAKHKNGVGKTTTCDNLGTEPALEGKKVLLIDTDPQGSLSISLGYVMPANIELSDMVVSFVKAMSRETVLKQYLDTVKKEYDFILLGCMPSLAMLTVEAIRNAGTKHMKNEN